MVYAAIIFIMTMRLTTSIKTTGMIVVLKKGIRVPDCLISWKTVAVIIHADNYIFKYGIAEDIFQRTLREVSRSPAWKYNV